MVCPERLVTPKLLNYLPMDPPFVRILHSSAGDHEWNIWQHPPERAHKGQTVHMRHMNVSDDRSQLASVFANCMSASVPLLRGNGASVSTLRDRRCVRRS